MPQYPVISRVVEFPFHSQATVAALGSVFEQGNDLVFDKLTVEIKRTTATASDVKFWGSNTTKTLDAMAALTGTKYSDETTKAQSYNGAAELFHFENIGGLKYIAMELDSITQNAGEGYVDVVGRFHT